MKAIVKKRAERGLWFEDVPKPLPAPHEVLIKTLKSSICGTDLHIYEWDQWAQKTMKVPVIIGHEFVGEIVALGSQVADLKVGQRVSGEGHIGCQRCRNCRTTTSHLCSQTRGIGIQRDGCFAEYFTLPANNVYLLANSIADDVASILDPLGNAVHTALSFDLAGEDVLITGAGPIGLMAVAIAKKVGAHRIVVTDINPYRLELAQKVGCSLAVHTGETSLGEACRKFGIREGFSVAMEMSGSPKALPILLEAMQPAGKVALLGILPAHTQIEWDHVIFKGLTIKGIYGREIFATWYKMGHLLQAGLDVTPIITHRLPFERFEEGFAIMRTGQCGKVILEWS